MCENTKECCIVTKNINIAVKYFIHAGNAGGKVLYTVKNIQYTSRV